MPGITSASPAFRTEYLRLSGCEPFFCVVDAETGNPPTIALRYALRERRRSGVRGLERRVQAVAKLYTSYAEASGGRSLEADLRAGIGPVPADFELAVRIAETGGGRGRVAGAIAPGQRGGQRQYVESSRAYNRRLVYWTEFILWALEPAHWMTRSPVRSQAEETAIAVRKDAFRDFVAGELRPESASVNYLPLTDAELAVIEAVLADDSPERVSSPRLLRRNRSIYYVCRYGGLRRGEALTVQRNDVPAEATGLSTLRVIRRPSDPAETRGRNAPAVKRDSRKNDIWLPTFVSEELRAYIALDRGRAPTPFLFVSTSGDPLSISAAQAVVHRIGAAAGRLFKRLYPGTPHTLDKLHWHRLRHTRAVELLDFYVPEPPAPPVPGGVTAFLDFFGWATEESAGPYIRRRLRERADRRLDVHASRIERSLEVAT